MFYVHPLRDFFCTHSGKAVSSCQHPVLAHNGSKTWQRLREKSTFKTCKGFGVRSAPCKALTPVIVTVTCQGLVYTLLSSPSWSLEMSSWATPHIVTLLSPVLWNISLVTGYICYLNDGACKAKYSDQVRHHVHGYGMPHWPWCLTLTFDTGPPKSNHFI